ncbi:MAG: class I SAM-dependent methyltransferase [Ottowia sp.]|uniref:class I SAM-dependent methyltransferase n=1 Tax=Ottowia sp. TaxID=1898956 RepID=UPI003C71BD43
MIESKENITYEFFGINPSQFYSGKFSGWACAPDYLIDPKKRFDIEYDRAKFLVKNISGRRILDIGCGSAPYGNTIRNNTNAKEIFGVDLDPECVENAKKSYDFASVFDLNEKLPFEDAYFDCVFSMDVFGHIEFKHKNHLLNEIYRVTKRGGNSVHGIECGIIDYRAANPNDPKCAITHYVWQEGHVGIEDAHELHSRWSQFFSNVNIENAFIWPLKPFASIKNMRMPAELSEILASYSQEQIDAVQVVLGFLQGEYRKHIKKNDPGLLLPNEDHPFSKHSGFVYLTAEKFQDG